MYGDNELEFPFSSDWTRSNAPIVGENALTQDGMGTGDTQAQQQKANASHPGQADLEARLARLEARQAYADASLAHMEACRRHLELRLQEGFEDVAYAAAGDVGLALLKQ